MTGTDTKGMARVYSDTVHSHDVDIAFRTREIAALEKGQALHRAGVILESEFDGKTAEIRAAQLERVLHDDPKWSEIERLLRDKRYELALKRVERDQAERCYKIELALVRAREEA